MSEAGMVKDSDRLPWLETPPAQPSRSSVRRVAGVGVAALAVAGAASLILFRQLPVESPPSPMPMPMARLELPQPVTVQPEAVEPVPSVQLPSSRSISRAAPRKAVRRYVHRAPKRRVLKSPVERLAYREVVLQQSVTAPMETPVPYDPPVLRPTVNPAAVLRRGKTVQLGAYKTPRQAEIAWQRAIRDYTFLVTFPKDISLVQLGPRKLRFYRLQLGTPSKRHALQLCSNLKTTGRNCTVA